MAPSEPHGTTSSINRRFIIEQAPADGRGAPENKPHRALTLVDRLDDNGNGILTADEWKAADTLRDLYLELTPPSEGRQLLRLAPGQPWPTPQSRSPRQIFTGIEITLDGDITQCLSRSKLATKWRFLDALVAAVGCTTDEGTACLTGGPAAILVGAALGVEGTPHLMPGTPQGSASG